MNVPAENWRLIRIKSARRHPCDPARADLCIAELDGAFTPDSRQFSDLNTVLISTRCLVSASNDSGVPIDGAVQFSRQLWVTLLRESKRQNDACHVLVDLVLDESL